MYEIQIIMKWLLTHTNSIPMRVQWFWF